MTKVVENNLIYNKYQIIFVLKDYLQIMYDGSYVFDSAYKEGIYIGREMMRRDIETIENSSVWKIEKGDTKKKELIDKLFTVDIIFKE